MNIRHTIPPPRLILYKALALSSLVLAAMLFSAPAARAGHWEFTCTGSGSNDDTSAVPGEPDHYSNWMPPGTQVGSFSLPKYGSSVSYRSKNVVTVTVTVTANWKADGGAGDTPPPSVWLCESASAEWTAGSSGSASDGFGDPSVPHSDGSPGAISYTATSNPPGPLVPQPPPHWKSWPVSGNSVTLPTRTLTAEGDYPNSPYGGTCGAFIDSYDVKVHAQPYGWYNAGWIDPSGVHHDGPYIAGGIMTFSWGWKSTSGSLADLTNITIYETVDYSGNPGSFSADNTTFYPQSPPIQAGYNVPNGVAGTPFNGQNLYARDKHSPFPVSSPAAITFTVPQKYMFDDSATQESGTLLYDCGNIVEGNFLNPPRWDTTELGSTAHTYYQ